MSATIRPYRLAVAEAALVDMRQRIDNVRWPEAETVSDWSQGLPLAALRRLRDIWLDHHDWRACERELNQLGLFETAIDGVVIRFLHVRSPQPDAMPLLLTHGWPGAIIEFLDAIPALADPVAHGGRAEDAFNLIVPALPGYGPSGKPTGTGWTAERTAAAWTELMRRLGYDRFVAQGGDWGAAVAHRLALAAPPELVAIHTNMAIAFPSDADILSEAQAAKVAALADFHRTGTGYAAQQSTRPQTLAYGLADSAMGQAAWIFEKFCAWGDWRDDPFTDLPIGRILDTITLYWLTNSGGSSARLYWESPDEFTYPPLTLPVGISNFPREIYTPDRAWAERQYRNIIHWGDRDRGGHFAAMEAPSAFVAEMRAFLRAIRRSDP